MYQPVICNINHKSKLMIQKTLLYVCYYKMYIYNIQSVHLFLLCHGEKAFSPTELYCCVCGDLLFIPRPGQMLISNWPKGFV